MPPFVFRVWPKLGGRKGWNFNLRDKVGCSWLEADQSCPKLLQPLSYPQHSTVPATEQEPTGPMKQRFKDTTHPHQETFKKLWGKIMEYWKQQSWEGFYSQFYCKNMLRSRTVERAQHWHTFFYSSVNVFFQCEAISQSLLTSLWAIIHAQLSSPALCAPGAWQSQLKIQGLIL